MQPSPAPRTSGAANPRAQRHDLAVRGPRRRCRQGDRQVLPPLPQRGIPQVPRLHVLPDIHMDNYAARKTEAAGSLGARRVHCTPTPWPGRTLLRLVDGKATEARCPLFDDNVYQRGEALVLKPALGGAGFEAERGACGTLKCRCPAAAFGCARRKECCRAAPGRRAVRVDKHDRRLFTPTPWGSSSWKRGPPFRPGSAAGSTTPAEKRYRRRLRPGLVTVVATSPGCLRAERQGGRWLARSGCAADRSLLKLAACGRGPARLGFAAQRRSDILPSFRKLSVRTALADLPGGGWSDSRGADRAAGQQNGTAQTPLIDAGLTRQGAETS